MRHRSHRVILSEIHDQQQVERIDHDIKCACLLNTPLHCRRDCGPPKKTEAAHVVLIDFPPPPQAPESSNSTQLPSTPPPGLKGTPSVQSQNTEMLQPPPSPSRLHPEHSDFLTTSFHPPPPGDDTIAYTLSRQPPFLYTGQSTLACTVFLHPFSVHVLCPQRDHNFKTLTSASVCLAQHTSRSQGIINIHLRTSLLTRENVTQQTPK